MENEERITLPMNLGIKVLKELKTKHDFKPRENNLGMLDLSFKEDELALIDSLEYINPVGGELKGISKLPNLKKVYIESRGVTAHQQEKNIASINGRDLDEIAKCGSIKSLSILNQAKADFLDVSKLSNLQELKVTHNQNLVEVLGLEQLHNLWVLDCFGNNRLPKIDNLDKAILQNDELGKLDLDVLLFPSAINYNCNTGSFNKDALAQIREVSEVGDVSWKESLNGNKAISINLNQMLQMHNRACKILDENVPKTADTRDTIVGIEEYLSRNVTYDYDAINSHTHSIKTNVNGVHIQDGPKFGTNSSYNALMKNSCVCEGYTRGMQYLLKLKGINSHNVDCFAEEDKTHMADSSKQEDKYTRYRIPSNAEYHSIICIDDYNCLYDDPCWNACYYQGGDTSMPWLLKTKSEISKDHTLSFDERNINNNHMVQPKNVIQSSIQRNELFRKTRMASLKDAKDRIAQHVKGQIIEREGKEI